MGNCLPFQASTDDTTPLHRTELANQSTPSPARQPSTSAVQDSALPPPPYRPVEHQRHLGFGDSDVGGPSYMSEEEQMQLARRLGLIQQLPTDLYVEGGKGDSECIICMIDFEEGDRIRFLPCMHCYHVTCIDDWLLRKFQCPSCMEPVDAALLSSFVAAELTQDELKALSASPGTTGKAEGGQ